MNKHEQQSTASDWCRRNEFLRSVGLHESQDRGDSFQRSVQRNEILRNVGLHIETD